MNDHQADIAASLRMIQGLLATIVGAAATFLFLTALGPDLYPFGIGLILFAYFYAHWREAGKRVDLEQARIDREMAKWKAHDEFCERWLETHDNSPASRAEWDRLMKRY